MGSSSWMRTVVVLGAVSLGAWGCSSSSSDDGSGGAAGNGQGGSGMGGSSAGGAGGMASLPPANDDCPSAGLEPTEAYGTCCLRTLNSADEPVFRIAAMTFSSPTSLANPFVQNIITSSFDEDRMNWLLALSGAGADGDIMARVGHAERTSSGAYRFTSGAAPGPGSSDRWDPVSGTGTITGEDWTLSELPSTITIPGQNVQRDGLQVELPFRQFAITRAAMSENRNCIGAREITSYSVMDGTATAFLTIEETSAVNVVITEALQFPLCALIAGVNPMDCNSAPQGTWPSPPDALCDDTSCTIGGCDPASTCNAWALEGGFAANAVELVQ